MTAPTAGSGPGVVDLHNHLVPGVDDGAADDDECRAGLQALAAQGVSRLAATPHAAGSMGRRPEALAAWLDHVDAGFARLYELARIGCPGLRVERAAEVMLDTPDPDLSEPRLRIAGGRCVLVEFPYLSVPPNSTHVLRRLCTEGWQPVLAHVERYHGLDARLELAAAWKNAGAVLQVNGPSLIGRYGAVIRRRAEDLLAEGLADYVASDFHARGDPGVARYVGLLGERASAEQVALLTAVNPARVADGEAPIPTGPVPGARGFWRRLFGR